MRTRATPGRAARRDARHERDRGESWQGLVDRELEPLGLVIKAGEWYLAAQPHGAGRGYRRRRARPAEPAAAEAGIVPACPSTP